MDRHKILYLWAVFTHTLLLFILLFLLSPDEEALGGRTQTMHRPLCTQVRRVERRLPEIPAPGIILHPGIPWSLKFYQFVYVCKSELAPRIPPDLTCLPLTRSPWSTLKKYLVHMNSRRHHVISTSLHAAISKILALFVLPLFQLCFTFVSTYHLSTLVKSEIHTWINLPSDAYLKHLLMTFLPLECLVFLIHQHTFLGLFLN